VSWAGWIFIGIFAISITLLAVGKNLLQRYSHIDEEDSEASSGK
jgi:hypothetical protein